MARRIAAFLTICLLTSAIAQALEQHDTLPSSSSMLSEVVVTATQQPRLLKDCPVQTIVISSTDIALSDPTSLQQLLQSELPSIEFSYAMNQQPHLNFGGFAGQNVLFLIDGQKMAGETMDDIDFSRIDVSSIERIEIIRGASSALYGSNASGGVVNIITRRPTDKLRAQIGFRAGSHALRRYTASIDNHLSKFTNSLQLTAQRISTFNVRNHTAPQAMVVTSVFGHRTLNARDRLTYSPLHNLTISANLGFFMKELPREVDAPERYRSYTAALNGQWEINPSNHLEATYSFDQYDKSQLYKISSAEIRSYSNVQNSVKLLYRFSPSKQHTLTVATQFVNDFLLNNKMESPRHTQRNFNIFAQHDWIPSTHFELVSALRFDHISQSGSLSRLTPKISARYSPISNLDLRAAYGMGFRAPSLKELFYDFDMAGIWTIKGNPNLAAELSHNFNFSIDYSRSGYSFSALAFFNQIKNRITTSLPYYHPNESQPIVNYINLPHYRTAGTELTIKARWQCGLGAKISYAYTYEHTPSSQTTSQFMPTRPHSISTRIDWHREISQSYSVQIALHGRWMSNVVNRELINYYSPADGFTRVNYPAYTIWQLTTAHTLFSRLTLHLTVDNLFNYRPTYYYLNSPLTTGTSFLAGINYKF